MSDWDLRRLCPDGACLGVIGPDGTCPVCGRAMPGWGDERQRGLLDPADAQPALPAHRPGSDPGDVGADGASVDEPAAPDRPSDADPAWTSRELCPDSACIGVLGPDRCCKVCGKADVGN